MSQAHQTFTGESPEAPPVTGDQTDSPEFTDSDMEFTNPFLLLQSLGLDQSLGLTST